MCSQSLLSVFGRRYDLDTITAAKIACGLGGGMSWPGQICGAVNGAVMVLGLAISNGTGDDELGRLSVQEAIDTFVDRFTERVGSTACNSLLGMDVATPEGYDEATRQDLFNRKCPDILSAAADILEELLRDYG